MTNVNEAIDNQFQLNAALKAGVNTLSLNQQISFVKYVKLILPLDGYVFWVRASLLSSSAQFNAAKYNSVFFNQPKIILAGANIVSAQGSLHHSILNKQDEDQNVAINRMTFTSEIEIQDLNEVSPMVMYIATVDNERFSFSERRSFYKRAGLHHYSGDAIYPTMETQIIDSVEAIDMRNVIVSNSLPIWLTLNQYWPMYPSYLVPDNMQPPFASVHIDPKSTKAIQSAPLIDNQSNHFQLTKESVNVTIFGSRNFNAIDFLDYVNEYSLVTDNIGLMNSPVPRDEKQWQTEISSLAMKKSFDFEISYYQARIRDVARQYITSCIPTYLIGPPRPPMVFGFDLALPYEGPFEAGEALPVIVFLNTAILARGVAYTESTGDGTFTFEDVNGNVVITVVCTAGNHYPQVNFTNGPATFYINQVLRPFAPNPTDSNLTDLTMTFGDVPYTWPN